VGSPLSDEVSHDQPSGTLGVPEKTINYFWDGEKSALVAAPGKEKNPFILVKRWPGRNTVTPIKGPAGLVQYRRLALSFLAKLAHPEGSRDGPALRSRNRLAFSRPPPLSRVLVLLGCSDLPGPARCSRDTAKVAVFRLASSHPQPETFLRGYRA